MKLQQGSPDELRSREDDTRFIKPGRRTISKQRPPNISKEILYENALQSKIEANKLRDENRRLTTKITFYE